MTTTILFGLTCIITGMLLILSIKKKKYYLANIRNINTDISFCVLIRASNKEQAYEITCKEFSMGYEIEIDETLK